jgi:ribonuclease BN (tRNA processing enzyme)
MKLTILGSAGSFAGPHSACSAYLVEQDGFRLLVDFGNGSTGVLHEVCGLLGPDAVMLSHLHGDHYLDLITYTYVRRYHPDGHPPLLPVYGPTNVRNTVAGAYGRDVDQLLSEVYTFDAIESDRVVEVGPFTVDLRRMYHPVETYGMRISAGGRSLAFSADTDLCEALDDIARDSDLFLCEASFLDGEDNPPGIHLTGRQAAEVAKRVEAKRLVLTHLVPWGDEARTWAEASAAYDGDLHVAKPRDVFEI